MIDDELRKAATRLLDLCRASGLKIATAESCTGGLVAAALTEIAGSSDVVDCGFVTYSNEAKQSLVGVPAATSKQHGAVSEETAAAMAAGALKNSRADFSVAITGIAGPGGGSKKKPVGLVYFAAASRGGSLLARSVATARSDAAAWRLRSVAEALELLGLLAEETHVWGRSGACRSLR